MRFRGILGHLALGSIGLSSTTTVFAFSFNDVFERASACGAATFSQCSGTGLPADFCCPSTATCITLFKNTTVLCCPNGSICTTIAPITCDIQQQNSTAHPEGLLKTTVLNSTLVRCGSACCPLGYSCTPGNQCSMDANQQYVQSSSSSSSVPTATSSSSPTTTAALPVSNSTISSIPITQPSCVAFPATAIIAGFFPGLILGAIIATVAFCIIGARRGKHQRLGSHHFGRGSPHVSDPIYQEGSGMRTDFLRKPTPNSSAPSTPTNQPTIQRVRSLFRKSAAANGLPMTPSPRPPMPAVRREPSSESINIFADPSTARNLARERESRQTTFTDMMERADLGGVRRGEPFVPRVTPQSARRSPPRSRLAGGT